MAASGYRVKQAREFKGLTQGELAERIGVGQSAIAQIELGLIHPIEQHMAAIAIQTGFPVSFFREHPKFEFPLPSHLLLRARQAFSARDKKQAHRYAEIAFEAISDLLHRVSIPPLSVPRNVTDVVSGAESFRSMLGFAPDSPLPSAMRVAERAGVLVFSSPLPRECDAFSCWVEAGTARRPAIFMSCFVPGDRQNWTIAHELGHIVMHDGTHSSRDAEDEADQFAAELLLPADAFRDSLGGPLTLTSAGNLKRKWFVAIQAIVRRAKELGAIDEAQYKSLMVQIGRRGWRTKEPYPIAADPPTVVRRIVAQVYGTPIDIKKFAADSKISTALATRIAEGAANQTRSEVTPIRRL